MTQRKPVNEWALYGLEAESRYQGTITAHGIYEKCQILRKTYRTIPPEELQKMQRVIADKTAEWEGHYVWKDQLATLQEARFLIAPRKEFLGKRAAAVALALGTVAAVVAWFSNYEAILDWAGDVDIDNGILSILFTLLTLVFIFSFIIVPAIAWVILKYRCLNLWNRGTLRNPPNHIGG